MGILRGTKVNSLGIMVSGVTAIIVVDSFSATVTTGCLIRISPGMSKIKSIRTPVAIPFLIFIFIGQKHEWNHEINLCS